MPFSFEHLTVYKLALDWITEATLYAATLKVSKLAPLSDQLIRAATSISLNIAEGNGRWHKGAKKQFFWIARGSIFECVAIIQAANINGILTTEAYVAAYDRLQSLAKLLTKLIQSVDGLRGKDLAADESLAMSNI